VRVSDLKRLYDYHYWANKKLLAVVSQLSPDEFTQSVAGSYGSVRNTLVHVVSAEWGWLDRCGGPARGARLNPADYPTAESLIETWGRVERYMREFLSTLTDDDLARDVEFSFGNGPRNVASVGDLLSHGVVHSVHHRGQVAMLLRLLGHVPGDFDLLYFAIDTRSVPA
jgi:uncharacterized damage-inducible protein DinB